MVRLLHGLFEVRTVVAIRVVLGETFFSSIHFRVYPKNGSVMSLGGKYNKWATQKKSRP